MSSVDAGVGLVCLLNQCLLFEEEQTIAKSTTMIFENDPRRPDVPKMPAALLLRAYDARQSWARGDDINSSELPSPPQP